MQKIDSRFIDFSGPGGITKADIGLGNVTDDSQVKRAEMGNANGVAELDTNAKVPADQIPALAISDTYVVSDATAMVNLSTAEVGDVAILTVPSETYILQATPPSTLSNWIEVLAPPAPVQSVNLMTGNVELTAADIGAASDGTAKKYAIIFG
jgi:hypothetical protein